MLTENDVRIMGILENNHSTLEDLILQTRIDQGEVQSSLTSLISQGLVREMGEMGNRAVTGYEITKLGRRILKGLQN